MVAKDFLSLYSKQQLAKLIGVEDYADRLSYAYTVVVLAVCGAVVTTETYFSRAIACHVPTTPSGSRFQAYAENYCWIMGTMPVRDNETLPQMTDDWKQLSDDRKISYYQWVPFMLGLQCMLFYLPRVAWQCVSYNRLGADLTALVVKANDALHTSNVEARQRCVCHVARSLELLLFAHRDNRSGVLADTRRLVARVCGICFVSKRMGTWTVFSYFCIKLLYLINCFGQLKLMRTFLGAESTMWEFGARFLEQLHSGTDWRDSLLFPRVSFCYLHLRHLGAIRNRYVAMCALPINMLNEKIYIFLFFWVYLVTILTAISLPIWFLRLATLRRRTKSIMRYLKLEPPKPVLKGNGKSVFDESSSNGETAALAHSLSSSPDALNSEDVNDFVSEFLRLDGVFLIHVLRINAGDVITGEIVRLLWQSWVHRYAGRHDFNNDVPGKAAHGHPSDDDEKEEKTKNNYEKPPFAPETLKRRQTSAPSSESHYV